MGDNLTPIFDNEASNEEYIINELLYKFCFDKLTYEKILVSEQGVRLNPFVKRNPWPTGDFSYSFCCFHSYCQKLDVEFDYDSHSFWINGKIFRIQTTYHYFERGDFFERFYLDCEELKIPNNESPPIVDSFIIHLFEDLPYTLFVILYEPLMDKHSLHKIMGNGISALIHIDENADELYDYLIDLCLDKKEFFFN